MLGAAAIALFWLACADPTGMCACPPARTHAFVEGFFYTEGGEPLTGAAIVTSTADGCVGDHDPSRSGASETVYTDSTSYYEAHLYSAASPHQACLTVLGVRNVTGDSVMVRGIGVEMVTESRAPERVRVDVVFPGE